MFLSRIQVDTDNRRRIKDLTHLGAYHNWVEQSFPDEIEASVRKRHLWRLDRINGNLYLLVLSDEKPVTEKMEKYGVPGRLVTKSYDWILNSLTENQQMRFRITANPTYSVFQSGDKRGKVYPHVTVEQQKKWFISKASKNGFEILRHDTGDLNDENSFVFDIVSRDRPILGRKKNRNVRLSRVTFEGILRIKDVDLFKHMLVSGIGREKAFGMGLMTIIPLE